MSDDFRKGLRNQGFALDFWGQEVRIILYNWRSFFFFFFCLSVLFLGPHSLHMEVPRLGV